MIYERHGTTGCPLDGAKQLQSVQKFSHKWTSRRLRPPNHQDEYHQPDKVHHAAHSRDPAAFHSGGVGGQSSFAALLASACRF
jgi:hypothetical protein